MLVQLIGCEVWITKWYHVCPCAYSCTDACGSPVNVGLIVKLIRRKVRITKSITHANEMWTRSPRLALSRRTFHYPKVDLEKNECGHDRQSWHCLGVPFTIWRCFGQQLEYMWARSSKLALSRLTFHFQTVNTILAYPSLSETNLDKQINVGTIVEVGTISAYLSL